MTFEKSKQLKIFIVIAIIVFLSSFAFTKNKDLQEVDGIIVSNSLNLTDLENLAANKYIFPPDSLEKAIQDSLIADSLANIEIDSTKIDSTARLKHFKYELDNNQFLEFENDRKKSFFTYPSQKNIRRTVELDSTGNFVIIREFIADNEIRYPLKMPIEEYIEMRLESGQERSWESLGYKYELQNTQDDLGQLFSDFTNIDIPLPSVSFLSIFGPPKINLRISGAVDIHGAWRNETTEGVTASLLGNTRNEPDFKQQVQINVSGTIGDKLTIAADWNTERTFEYENQLKLHYKGYEDEIIQSVEAGNVSLQTSSLVGGGEALFGIKALFQFGPFSLTALASQKKGETEEVSVTGGSQTNEFEIHAYDYSKNHYFVDKIYADTDLNIFNNYYGDPDNPFEEEYQILQLEVWKTTATRTDKDKERKANAFIDLPVRETSDLSSNSYDQEHSDLRSIDQTEIPGRNVIDDRFILLEEDVDYTYNPYTGFISFTSQVNTEDAIAVALRQTGAEGDVDSYYGEFVTEFQDRDTSGVILLKLVKPPNLKPGGDFEEAWSLQLKNIYPIGGRQVNKEGFELDIVYEEAGKEAVNTYKGKSIIQEFGLDVTDESGTGEADGQFDYDVGRTIFTSTGEIIFPVLQPFGKDFPFEEELAYQSVYDTTVSVAKDDKSKDKFLIVGEYSADASSVYSIGFNVVENSVKVTLDGATLQVGTDYTVDYNIGQVMIIKSEATLPGANLKITYEKNDLFQLASKTLLGLRGLYNFSEKTKLGFSYLNLNQTTLSDKVRIGEEPLDNSIFGIDFQTAADLPFITDGLNNVISTKEMSSFNLKGEAAYMSPDPNTKKSNIDSDDNLSIAYIDDFEGAKRTIPIGVSYAGWREISPPDLIPGLVISTPQQRMNYKAKSFWYNIIPSSVSPQDIWGDRKSTTSKDNQVTVLDYVFDPEKRGPYNYDSTFYTNQNWNPMQHWGGMMKPLSSSANNLIEENIEYIEFYMNIDVAPESTYVYFDLGLISEDVTADNQFNTEDFIRENDLLDEGEDVGLDGLTNAEEIEEYGDIDGNGDPSGDDFTFQLQGEMSVEDYYTINGTQGNGTLSEAGRLPDTEDLGRANYGLEKVNSYFRYKVPLDTSRSNNNFISGGGSNGWYQYRIPLRDSSILVGNPTLTDVEVLRIWVTGAEEPVHLRFAEMNLVGNQWEKVIKDGIDENDTTLVISTINYEDNPEYDSPPGVERERDRTQTEEVVYKNEQSLQIFINDLEDGDSREIAKYLYRPLDVFSYKKMKMFIHGDLNDNLGSISYYDDEVNYGAEVYFRFGADTSNFYEYRQPIKAGWNEIEIDFADLTVIKQERTTSTELYQSPANEEGHYYGIKGLPSLTKINYFSFGVLNVKPENSSLVDQALVNRSVSGELWLNELRVLGADDTPGWAYTSSASIKLADLVTVNLNVSKTDPYFHRLNERFGSRVDNTKWGGSVNFNFLKLIPWKLTGSNLSLSYSRSESISKPLYLPGTDVSVNEAVKEEAKKLEIQGFTQEQAQKIASEIETESQTVNVSDTWSMSNIQFKLPSKAWYIEDIINNLQFSFNYNKSFSRSPSVAFSRNWLWNGSGKYSLKFGTKNYFKFADIPLLGAVFEIFEDYKDAKFYFTPQNFNTGLSASRKSASSLSRTDSAEVQTTRDFTAKRNFGFNYKITEDGILNLSLGYNANVSSSYAHLLAIDGIDRPEEEIWNDIYNGQLFGKDYSYSQTFDIKTKPTLPSLWNINRYLNITLGYNVGYNWSNNFKQVEKGRSAKYSNSIRAGMTLKLKSLMDPLFEEAPEPNRGGSKPPKTASRGRTGRRTITQNEPDEEKTEDVVETEVTDSTVTEVKVPVYTKAFNLLKMASKYILFDYESISMNFSQSNSASGAGLIGGGTGFANFWSAEQKEDYGPNRLFMLGLSNDLGDKRAPLSTMTDNLAQKNSVDFKTSRPLWDGATINLNWDLGWSFNKATTISTDDLGNVFVDNISSSGTLDRSFISLPIFFSNTGIKVVNELYTGDKKLGDAFIEGFETIPFLSSLPVLKDVAKYVPRANWRLDWRGLEKLSFIEGLAKSVSLSHAYNSSYSEGWKVDVDGNRQTQVQRINYGFSPLVGLNVTFDELWGGNLSGSFKYSTKSSFDLSATTKNITESFSKDINLTASFSKSGFSLPMFGLDLKNDIEMSFSYTSTQNSVVIFNMGNEFTEDGTPQDGTLRTIIEPRVKYTLSSKVTLSVFYKRTAVEPEGASQINPTTTNEAGLDVHISIQ